MQRRQIQYGVVACLLLGACAPLSTAVPAGLSAQSNGRDKSTEAQMAVPARVESATADGATGLVSAGGGGLVSNGGVLAPPPPVSGRSKDASMPSEERPPASSTEATRVDAVQAQAGALKAGSVDDNADFEGYLRYRSAFNDKLSASFRGQRPREAAVEGRRVIKVVNAQGQAVANADITVEVLPSSLQSRVLFESTPGQQASGASVTRLRTYADGQALFHGDEKAKDASYQVTVKRGSTETSKAFSNRETDWVVTWQEAPPKADSLHLDLAIVLDTTGSMGGEISKFQATMGSIAMRIQELAQKPTVRYGLVAYRDQDDDYVTRHKDFSDDLQAFRAALNQLEAGGGGDKPENLEAGLSVMLNSLQWSEDDKTVRLAVLVADAVPHTGYPQSTPYTQSMRQAAQKGIKLFPIGASGLEAEGEYVMRQLAQWTMGQYMFITRGGDASSGGGSVSATVDQYREGRLDDIVVNLVQRELSKFGK